MNGKGTAQEENVSVKHKGGSIDGEVNMADLRQSILSRLLLGWSQVNWSVQEHPDAAVLMACTREESSRLLLTQRSDRLLAHAGEVAFPGGKCDPTDAGIEATALREGFEEVGLQSEKVEVWGAGAIYVSRAGLKVQTVLALIEPDAVLVPSPDEIAEIFYVPLSFFLEQRPSHDHQVGFMGQTYSMPCFRYQGFVIWGLTAYMLVDILNRTIDARIDFPLPQVRSS